VIWAGIHAIRWDFCGIVRLICPAAESFRYPRRSQFGGFGGGITLAEVRVQEGEPLENALRRFKRKVQQEDIIKEVKRHSYYLKPGEKKRVKAALARKRNRKKARKEQE
jgi:small subunit ribosomal protein S21